MYFLRSFIVGGYAYYRKKKLEHGNSVTMLILPVFGLPTLIIAGVVFYISKDLSAIFDKYVFELIFMFLAVGLLAIYKMEKFLEAYQSEEMLNTLSRDIHIHNVIVYSLVAVNVCVWYFLR
ncbi:hypothetical protein HWQ46_23515 [Shewanella sp. D64]|uniref:hypothetical protein n=1 Tax=unclassified Shewanella TaxID=196818 RepID=UPI0022BA271F|nr:MULTISPECIES: hypothetical protein [unclassified Shewanella]MEC4728495.1 hypothetical protein [Shewanella sp. D64]MEC4740473.1 hypothetical protein [Shewanella sp. E94]WBJ95139.1 hypothetical protein HWQ47_25580 [Shewanella sp. MTB7]